MFENIPFGFMIFHAISKNIILVKPSCDIRMIACLPSGASFIKDNGPDSPKKSTAVPQIYAMSVGVRTQDIKPL